MFKKLILLCMFTTIALVFSGYAQDGYRGGYLKGMLQKLRVAREGEVSHPIEEEISPDIRMLMPGGAFPVWSAVTNKITFTKMVKGQYEVFVMDSDGSNVKCLTCGKLELEDCGNRGQSYWHPSGKYIVFSAENANFPRQGLGKGARPGIGRNFNVWVMTADGENFYQLTDYSQNWGVIETKFSHDGTKIFWNEEFSMEKYPEGKAGDVKMPRDPSHTVGHPGSYWGRESFEYRKGEEACAWRVVYADITFTVQGPKISNIRKINPPDGFTVIESNGFTPDDSGFIYSYAPFTETRGVALWGEIYTSDIKGGNFKRLTLTPFKHDEDPVYSPDGRKIVYKEATQGSGMPPDGCEVFIINADGSNRVQLTHFFDPAYPEYRQDWRQITEMDWSPDGKQIVFGNARSDEAGPGVNLNSDIYVLTIPEQYLE